MKHDLFDTTEEFSEKLYTLIDLPLFDDSSRLVVSNVACSLSLEHWAATLCLLKSGTLPSAAVVHRAQFEALLRSIWILYAASDEQLSRLSANLSVETEQNAKNLPLAFDMMEAINKKGPPEAYEALNRFKENSWRALNSYVHAGIHSIKRHEEGYPIQLIESLARNANGLATLSAMQAVVLSGTQSIQREILDLAAQYPDCMPQLL